MNTLLEMSGERLHWKVLLKYIKSQVKEINGFILERDVIRHFVNPELKSNKKVKEGNKVKQALDVLYRNQWCSVSLGETENGVGRVITLLKYPTSKLEEDKENDDTGNI